MNDEPSCERSSASTWMFSAMAAIVAYAISPGVFMWADSHGHKMSPLTEQVFEVVYAPLGFLNDHVPVVESFYGWYFKALR